MPVGNEPSPVLPVVLATREVVGAALCTMVNAREPYPLAISRGRYLEVLAATEDGVGAHKNGCARIPQLFASSPMPLLGPAVRPVARFQAPGLVRVDGDDIGTAREPRAPAREGGHVLAHGIDHQAGTPIEAHGIA